MSTVVASAVAFAVVATVVSLLVLLGTLALTRRDRRTRETATAEPVSVQRPTNSRWPW